MSADLVPVGSGEFPVLARDLHAALSVQKKYPDWFKSVRTRIPADSVSEMELFPPKGKKGRPRIEHEITLRAAKKISMMTKTDKGDQVRDYFLECERRAHEPLAITPAQAGDLAGLLAANVEAIKKLTAFASEETDRADRAEALIEEQRPTIDWAENLKDSEGLFSYRTAVRMAGVIGHQKLTHDLRKCLDGPDGFFIWEAGFRVWREPLRKRGLGKNVHVLVSDGNGEQKDEYPPRFTLLGVDFLRERIKAMYGQATLPLDKPVKPLPRRLAGDRQRRLPEGARR